MSKKYNQPIAKRKSISKKAKNIRPVLKNDNSCVSGGAHPHWRSFDSELFTDEDGWHDHIFLIGGKLFKTEFGGLHRHPITRDGSVGSQITPHGHSLFIDKLLHVVELGGRHEHTERFEDDFLSPGGTHRHFTEVDGVTYESLLPEDILSVEIRKSLHLGVQSILFNKTRFLTFETAAQKAEEMGFDLKKFEERTDQFVFTQLDQSNFREMSLQTITLEDGIEAVIGVLVEEAETSENDLGQSALSQAPSSSTPSDVSGASHLDEEEEINAFDHLQEQLSLGYVVMSEDQRAQLSKVKEDVALSLISLREIVDKTLEPVTQFIDQSIEKAGVSNHIIARMDRVNTGLILLDQELIELKLPKLIVEIEKDLVAEITAKTPVGVCAALNTISEFTFPLVELFKDTTFENFHRLLKAVNLSCNKLSNEMLDIHKAINPTESMTREELRDAQKERSDKFGIEVVDGSALTFPKGFPQTLSDYGDPVNLKFPFETIERARNARVRFKQFANQIYDETKSKRIVHKRIVLAELSFGINVTIDLGDDLDLLLPASFKDKENVTVIEASANIDKVIVRKWFVPIHKQDDEERTVFGIVLEPNVVDLQGDTYDEETVKNTAHFFMENFQNIGKQHKEIINDEVKILETFIAPTDMVIETEMGPVEITKNTWLMKVRIISDSLWAAVKNGEFTGFSIGALATVIEL